MQGAVQLYLKGNQPAKALAAALADPNMANDQALMQSIAQALLKGHIYDKVGCCLTILPIGNVIALIIVLE